MAQDHRVVAHDEWLEARRALLAREKEFAKLAAYRERMGWSFKWLSSAGTDFNHDYGVSFEPDETDDRVYNFGTIVPGLQDREGMSVFTKDEDGRLFRTYSTYARGIDMLNAAYN